MPTSVKPLFQFHTTSTADLKAVAEALQSVFAKRTLLLLEGPVGAGKTELVKRLTQVLGLPETASPSFAIHHRYESPENPDIGIDHVDLYRLDSEDDLESTGFWDLFGADFGIVVIEWSDRLNQELLPLNWKKIKVEISIFADPTKRAIKISEII